MEVSCWPGPGGPGLWRLVFGEHQGDVAVYGFAAKHRKTHRVHILAEPRDD
jgi:hypothetical protein